MAQLRIHPTIRRGASETRVSEWEQVLAEINGSADAPVFELLDLPGVGLALRLYDAEAAVSLDGDDLDQWVDDYAETIEQMVRLDREAPVRGFEALDYAKRVVHDEAAAWLQERAWSLAPLDLDTARRFFTVVFLVLSELPEAVVRYHRRH